MSTKELQEELVTEMRRWQKIEDKAASVTASLIANTTNPLLRLILEIIHRDSMMHYRVQALIADSFTRFPVTLDVEELTEVWDAIEKHLAIEKKMVSNTQQMLEKIKGKKMLIPEYLLNYLLEDEKKHDNLLESLEQVKAGMYPYSG